ncbi:hypothetical protein GDO78_002843 [Eleutherodactylus coqui]|uniref:Uncharacterized protein n=1 Tax=Eleutherodactylus coqui TaxID=57060 RepID=A0A8J6K240_ELECQ|nr:hypothetical protein GDO78_002843 [Eleutherodactylus coqui]
MSVCLDIRNCGIGAHWMEKAIKYITPKACCILGKKISVFPLPTKVPIKSAKGPVVSRRALYSTTMFLVPATAPQSRPHLF